MWSIQHVSLFEAGACLLAPEIQRFFKQLRPEPGKHWRISIILLATAAALESLSFIDQGWSSCDVAVAAMQQLDPPVVSYHVPDKSKKKEGNLPTLAR